MAVASHNSIIAEIRDTFRYRWVVFYFVYSFQKHRYRKSFLGYFWSVLAPLMQNLVVGFVFFSLFRFDMKGYLLYLFSGIVIFSLFAGIIGNSPTVFINNENFIKRIHVPKFAYVLQIVLLETVNFMFIFISLLILGIVFRQIAFTTAYIFLVVPIVLAILLLIGEVCIIGIMTVYFRDLAFIVPVVMQTLFFLTPVYYPITMMPARLQQIIGYNPLYWYVELFRKPIYEGTLPSCHLIAACSVLSVSLCVFGLWILKKYDNKIIFRL
jgi:ABC-type polysaccharide/polyol phosphate export permease